MHSSILVLAAGIASVVAIPQAAGTIGLGQTCDPSVPNQCANGANCYATNSMLIPSCGNFQASCTTSDQCAFNTCNNGLCNGFLPTESYKVTPTPTPTSTSSTTSSITRPTATGKLPLGANCNPAIPDQCANGVECYATNSMLMPRCGNFRSSCTSDAQCAFNTCNNGLCNGFLPTSSSTANPTQTSSSSAQPTATGSIPLGERCDPAIKGQCAKGADCYATNSMLMTLCGNFQSSCASDAQCAFNKCNSGFCNGPPLSSLSQTTNAPGTLVPLPSNTTTTHSKPTQPPTYVNSTTTLPYATGYTTSVVVVDGQMSSVLVNGAGATTSFGASPTGTIESNGAAGTMASCSGVLFALAAAFAALM